MLVGLFALALFVRMVAPSDLYDNEQPKTIAYTVDVLVNGRWILPHDMLGGPPHKPPLYNWLAAPIVGAFDLYREWAFKLPSIISAAVTMGLTVGIGAWLVRRRGDRVAAEDRLTLAGLSPVALGAVAAAMWLASHTGMKMLYLARPDPLLIAFMMVAWWAATASLLSDRPRFWVNLLCWLSVTGAAMCKGPPALIVPIYIVLGGKLLAGQWSAMWRTGIGWGLPLAIALVGTWLGAAYWVDARIVVEELIGDQAVGKITRRGPIRIVTEFYKSPGYLIVRFVPWSLVAILTLVHIPPRRWFAHPLGPAILWTLVIVGFFMIPADKRGDYLAPATPAVGLLAAYWLLVVGAKYRMGVRSAFVGVLVVLLGLTIYHGWFSNAAQTGYGRNVKHFVADVRELTGGEPIAFYKVGYNPLQPLLGANQTEPPPEETTWSIMPLGQAAQAGGRIVLTSEPLPGIEHVPSGRLALVRRDTD